MMKRYMMVFVALCLLFATNVCSAEESRSVSVEDYLRIDANPKDYGSRWQYLYTYESAGFNQDYPGEEVYFDKASPHFTTIRNKRVLEFTLWHKYRHISGSRVSHESWPEIYIADLDNHKLYHSGRGGSALECYYTRGQEFKGDTSPYDFDMFPPKEVFTSDSAYFYTEWDNDRHQDVSRYPGLNAQQLKDYKLFLTKGSSYAMTPGENIALEDAPDLVEGVLSYDPDNYEFIDGGVSEEECLFPEARNLGWSGFGYDIMNNGQIGTVTDPSNGDIPLGSDWKYPFFGREHYFKTICKIKTKLIPVALQIANQQS